MNITLLENLKGVHVACSSERRENSSFVSSKLATSLGKFQSSKSKRSKDPGKAFCLLQNIRLGQNKREI